MTEKSNKKAAITINKNSIDVCEVFRHPEIMDKDIKTLTDKELEERYSIPIYDRHLYCECNVTDVKHHGLKISVCDNRYNTRDFYKPRKQDGHIF